MPEVCACNHQPFWTHSQIIGFSCRFILGENEKGMEHEDVADRIIKEAENSKYSSWYASGIRVSLDEAAV